MNLRDALIQSPSGRHLWLKLVLRSSDENKTPRIRSISAYLPRSSYLRYLPAVYQEDTASRDFLERFLSLFETLLWNNEEAINQIGRFFDVEATPDEFISWLATWVAAISDESWSEEKKRIFLQRAVALYKKRGTREGLEELIEIYTGYKPMIIEHFQLRCAENEEIKSVLEKLFGLYLFSLIAGDLENDLDAGFIPEELKNMFETKGITLSEIITVTKEDNDKWRVVDEEKESTYIIRKEGKNLNIYFWTPFCFCVLLKPAEAEIYGSQLETVKRLIEFEKPAHTVAGVMVLQPWIYLDMHTYLGINTYLSEPVMRLGITSVIGRDTVLTDMEEAGQIERRARTGMDTNLT
jgi:phage tail-like protein